MRPSRVHALAVKELRQAMRDPLTLGMLLGLPTLMLLLYGYAINFDVRHVRLAVQDESKSAASRDLVSSFVNSGYFDLVADLPPAADLVRLTSRRQARAILIIPLRYARDLAAGRAAEVQLVLDGADANTASTVLGYAAALVADAGARLAAGSHAAAGPAAPRGPVGPAAALDVEPRVWYNPELRSTQFLVPGLVGFILMITAVLSTALSVVREKERGTMEQLQVSSLTPGELIAGKALPYLAISLAATAIILAVARLLFGIVVRGSYLDLFLATLLYLTGALGFGLLVSSFARTQAMAFQVGALTSMLPALFLSGFIFPLRAMPAAVRALSFAVPARYFLVMLRGIVLKGAGLSAYGRDLAFLLAYGAIVLALSYVRLRARES